MPDNPDDFLKASAEEWSKEETPSDSPAKPETSTDRWGSPISTPESTDPDRWGSEKIEPSTPPKIINANPALEKSKKKLPWWVILIIVFTILCICGSLTALVLVLKNLFT